jgi:hypothetical protein
LAGNSHGVPYGRIWQQHGEFLASIACDQFPRTPRRTSQCAGKGAQAVVTRLVSVSVVEAFEVVHIQKDQPQRQARSNCAVPFLCEQTFKVASVRCAGQPIGVALQLKPLDSRFQGMSPRFHQRLKLSVALVQVRQFRSSLCGRLPWLKGFPFEATACSAS